MSALPSSALTLANLARGDYEILGWMRQICTTVEGGVAYRYEGTGMTVICSIEEAPSRRWLHVSVAHPKRYPTWEELRAVKEGFIGPNRHAVQHLPRVDEHVSVHPNCFHLWAILDGEDPFDEVSGSL